MANEVEIDGKKFKLVPVPEKEAVIDSFEASPSTSILPTPSEDPLEPADLPAEVPVVKGEPTAKTGVEMMIKTAKTIGTARVERVVANSKERRDYEAKIGRLTGEKKFFPGSGIEDTSTDDFDEE